MCVTKHSINSGGSEVQWSYIYDISWTIAFSLCSCGWCFEIGDCGRKMASRGAVPEPLGVKEATNTGKVDGAKRKRRDKGQEKRENFLEYKTWRLLERLVHPSWLTDWLTAWLAFWLSGRLLIMQCLRIRWQIKQVYIIFFFVESEGFPKPATRWNTIWVLCRFDERKNVAFPIHLFPRKELTFALMGHMHIQCIHTCVPSKTWIKFRI